MLARVVGVILAAAAILPAQAGDMNADEARRFVAGKMFAFNCFDGTKGLGRINNDGSATGSIQFSGAGPVRYAKLPPNTLQVKDGAVCASLKGLFFEPCFNLNKTSETSFRGAVSGMGFAYCDFTRAQARAEMLRVNARPRIRAKPTETANAEPAALNLRPSAE